MFRNYLRTAVRNLLKNKFYSSINIIGLAIGLCVGIMILLWVQDELSYNRFHANAANIYKINSHLGTGADEQVWAGSPSPVALYSKKRIPGVVDAVRIKDVWEMSLFAHDDKKLVLFPNAYVDPSFFNVFTFQLTKGDNNVPFKDANSVVITTSTAKKLFGDQDPIGKIIVAESKENFTVTGVMEDFPTNSTITYNMLFPMAAWAKKFGGNGDWKTIDDDLGNYFYSNYLMLKPGTNLAKTQKMLGDIFNEMHPGNGTTFKLQRFVDTHLYTVDGNDGAMQTVKTFMMVAVLILLIACINYVNLSTARSMLRSKEVSVRKIIGAQRQQLFMQFIVESALIFAIGSVLAIGLVKILFPFFNEISGKEMVFSISNAGMWTVILLAILGSLIVGSIYPALLLSSFKPLEALKGKLSFGAGNVQFRKVLVVVQFVFSVALIISTIVIGMQLKFIREKNLGYDKEHVFAIAMRDQLREHYSAVRNELMKQPGVLDVSSADAGFTGMNGSTGDTDWEGKQRDRMFLINVSGIDEHHIPLFKLQFADGKNFTGEKSDSAHIILNEAAVQEAGIKNPVGKRFKLWDNDATIIGVVKNFNYASLRQRIQPMAFYYQPASSKMFIKTNGRDANKAIAAVQSTWQKYITDYPFSYKFLDEDYNDLYKTEQRTGMLFNMFAIVAIVISCLGLFGLAAYTAQVKTKEIGIRKVLGATVTNIVQLLAKDFIALVVISLIIAIPIGWWAMNTWLQDFVYRINISWWIFAGAGVIAIFIALITVSSHAIRAALANPVTSLKEE